MMNTLQEIINEMHADCIEDSVMVSSGWKVCLRYYIPKLELLLNNAPGASAETALLQTPVLGEVPATLVKDETIQEVAGGLGETPAVRQNEQAKEHFYCLLADGYSGPRCNVPCSIEGCIKMRLTVPAE